jgi:hypothetical protein
MITLTIYAYRGSNKRRTVKHKAHFTTNTCLINNLAGYINTMKPQDQLTVYQQKDHTE